MNNFEANTFSVNDVLHTLRACERNGRYDGLFEHMLAFASELTGISEDTLLSSMYPEQAQEAKQPNPWEDLYKKYPKDRGEMSLEEETSFVNECFAIYEQEGFSKVFWTPFSDQESRKGQSFEVVGRCTLDEQDLSALPMWKIRFQDGLELPAYPEEIIPSEMRANGCRILDDKKADLDETIQSAAERAFKPQSSVKEKDITPEI